VGCGRRTAAHGFLDIPPHQGSSRARSRAACAPRLFAPQHRAFGQWTGGADSRRRRGCRAADAMSGDDADGLQPSAAGLLQDIAHDSGMMQWVQDLGLSSHVPGFFSNSEDADGLQLDNGPAHEDVTGGVASRDKRPSDAFDSPAPSKRPARNLDYADSESHDAIQGMLHLSDKDGIAMAGSLSRTSVRASIPIPSSRDTGGDGAGSRFLACVAGARDEDDPPHSPAEHEGVPHTPSSSGPRRVALAALLSPFARTRLQPPAPLLLFY